MDPWSIGLVGGIAICCVLAVVTYAIILLAMREKTFEEALAEERKRREEENEKMKSDRKLEKQLLKKKYKKGKGDKSKEKVLDQEIKNSQPPKQNSKKHKQKEERVVNLKTEPEIIDPSAPAASGKQKHQNASGVRKRSILHNRDEIAPIVEKAAELHHTIKPLDDLELKKLHDKKVQQEEGAVLPSVKKGKGQNATIKHNAKETKMEKTREVDLKHGEGQNAAIKQEIKEAKMEKTRGVNLKNAVAAEQRGTDYSSSTAVSSGDAVNGSQLKEVLRSAELSEDDMHSLMEILMIRQGTNSNFEKSKNKKSQKGDPVMIMTRQLEEKDKAIFEEHQLLLLSTNQLKEVRKSLTLEKEKLSVVEKHYQGQLEQQEAEAEALRTRLSNVHTMHVSELAKIKAQLEQIDNDKAAEAARCLQLKQENKILQDSLSTAVMETASKGDISGLKQKVSIMERELSSNAVRLNASENAKKSSEEKLKKLQEQLKNTESTKKSSEDSLRKQVADLKEDVKRKEAQNTQLSGDLKKVSGALSAGEAECTMWKGKLQELEAHLSSLGDMGARLQEAERKRSALEGNAKSTEKQLVEAVLAQKEIQTKLQASETKRQDLEGNLKNLEKQLADAVHGQRETSVELQKFRQENLSLYQELKTAQEKQQMQGSSANEDSKDFIHTAEHQRIVSEKVNELGKLQAALDLQMQKNNEEVKRAVTEAEKMDREALKRLFPAVSLSESMGHKEWLVTFEKQVAKQQEQTSSSEKNLNHKLTHLADENSRLQADVEVFKNNIAILHSEKDRIHDLESENRKLQQQSESYEKNFVQMNADQERLLHVEEENQKLRNLVSANSSLSEEVSGLKAEKESLHSQLQTKEESITEAENKLRDLEKVVEAEEKKWKEKLKQAEEKPSQEPDSSQREQELEELTIQQQTQIEHYRTALTNTEQLLRQLETADNTWEDKYQDAQEELNKCKTDYKKAQEELHALRGSQEMQFKMDDLQEELRLSSERVDKLTQSNEELTSKVIVLESQNKAVTQVNREDLTKELEEMRSQLDGERKRSKELSSTLVRLNGIIKTGQDALSQEQTLVKQLQEQLSDKSKATGSSASQEIEQGTPKGNDHGTSV